MNLPTTSPTERTNSEAFSWACPYKPWADPRISLAIPLACILASLVARPTPSCTLPATFLTVPSTRFSSIASSPVTLTHRSVNYAQPYQLECPHPTRQRARITGAARSRLRSDSQPQFQALPRPCRAPLIDRPRYLRPGESGLPSPSAPKRSHRR